MQEVRKFEMVHAYDLLFELLGTGEENTGKRLRNRVCHMKISLYYARQEHRSVIP